MREKGTTDRIATRNHILELALMGGIVFNGFMQLEEENNKRLLLIALTLSLLLHALMIVLFYYFAPTHSQAGTATAEQTRQVQIVREKKQEPKDSPTPPEKQEEKDPRFAKTSAETPEQVPQEPDYIGSRDTSISGDKNPAQEQSDDDTPSMEGEDKDELNTVEQDKQEGDLEFDGLKQTQAQQPPPSPIVAPEAPVQPSTAPPPSPEPSPKQEQEQKPEDTATQNEQSEQRPTEEPIKTIHPLEDSPKGDILIDDISFEPTEIPQPETHVEDSDTPAPELPAQQSHLPRPSAQTKPIYDPMFTADAQPGFRTTERRSRSTGRFIIGKNATLNVAATPLGRYQELIYRRIAYYWYAMVADNCGDVLPGSLTIRLLVNHKGQITSMELVSRSGASVSQQSITFAAIRKASIPPMPLDVQEGIVGGKLDLLFTFYFD